MKFGRFNGFRTLASLAILLAGAAVTEAQTVALSGPASYHQGDNGQACPTVTITCAAGYWGTSGIRLVIPPLLNMTWDTSMVSGSTLSVTGTAQSAGHIAASPTFSFANGNKTIIITVASTFVALQTAIIDNLRFSGVGAPSSGFMRANWDGTDIIGANTKSDGNLLTVVGNPTVSSGSDQSISPPSPVPANAITITDAGTPGIFAASNLRITIPAGLHMTWNPLITTVGIAMSGAGVVSTTLLPYEDGNKTAVLNVTTNFGSGASVTVSGLQFSAIGTDSGPFPLTVTTNGPSGAGNTGDQGTDVQTKTIFGLPTISSAAIQKFTVGDPATTALQITVTESSGTPKINAVDGISLIIPAGFNMTWDPSVGSVAVSGTAQTAGHILAAPAVTYSNGNRTVLIPVQSGFTVSQTAKIDNLRFIGFSGASPANRLQLDIDGNGTADSIDAQTIAIGAPTISSGGLQVFQVSDPTTTARTITVTDGTPARITAANGIRIKIPVGLNLEFDTTRVSGAPLVFGGAGAAHTTGTITYIGTQTALINLATDFTAGQILTIAGLGFRNFTAPSTPKKLQLEVNNLGTNCAQDAFNIAIGGIPSISSLANQSFAFNDPSTTAVQITITDANVYPSITMANAIQIQIPNAFPMEWNTSIVTPTVTFSGTGSGHVAGMGAVTYPDVKTVQINLGSDFGVAETLVINGLQFRNFTAPAAPVNLDLFVDPVGGGVPDDKTIGIGRPAIALSGPQSFGVGDASTVLSPVTVTDDSTVARITAAGGILIQIPGNATLNMTWDTAIQTLAQGLSFSGTGAAHVSAGPTIVTYPTTKTALIALQGNFAAGETLVISGLKVHNFGSTTGPGALSLSVHPSGNICNSTSPTLSIGARPILLSVSTADTNGNGSIDHLILTYDKAINPVTTSVTAGLGFSVVAPNYTIGAGSASGAVVTLALVEKGSADTGATPSIVYDPLVGNLQDLSGLTTNSTGPMVAKDGAAPVAMGITKVDSNGNGHLDSITIVFSENLLPGQEDAADWKLFDADGSTDLLQGLVSMAISGNSLTFTLADSFGTTGTPSYLYLPNGNLLKIQDLAVPANVTVLQTNAALPNVVVNQDFAVGPSKVILDASRSTDPNGQPLTFSWTNGPPALTGGTTATPFFLGTTAGIYTYTVTVSNLLVSASKDVHVTILNIPPGADAGSDQTVTPGQNPVYVVALASTDANGDSLNFSWTQISGHAVVLNNPNLPFPDFIAPTPSAVAPPDNILVFEVSVSDGVNTSKSRATVRVNGLGNLAPTADAGRDQVAFVGDTVRLDGSLSRDPEGAPLSYQWTSTLPPLQFPGTTIVNPQFIPALPGLYTFQLTVTDAANLSSFPSTVRVLVQSPANQAPVAVAHRFAPLGEIVKGDQIVLDATGSTDPEGHALTYAWLQVAGPQVILENPSALRPTFTPVLAATYSFQLTVSDGVNQSVPDRVSVTVKDTPASITFTTTLTGGTGVTPAGHFTLPGSFLLNIATSDPVNTWYFYLEQTAGPAVGINSSYGAGQLTFPFANPTLTYTVSPTVPGLYSFRLAATSLSGIRAYATFGVVVDGPAAYIVPVALASAPLTAVAGQMVTLDSAGSSVTATKYYWTQLEGPPVTLSDPKAAAPTLTPIAAGQYTFALTVADTTSSSAPSFVVVTVSAAPAATASSGGGGGGGCGFLGLEGFLLLPLLWLLSALRNVLPVGQKR